MSLFSNIPGTDFFRNPVVTIGNFDGIHIGHQKILSTLLDKAADRSGEGVVVTFASHPRKVLNPEAHIKIITTTNEKINAIGKFGIRNIVLLEFTREIANMNARDFYDEFLVKKIGAKEIVIGYDHAFGKNREGNIDFLKELSDSTGIGITRVEGESLDSRPASSTWLRKEIAEGNTATVTALLGRPYTLSGVVSSGAKRGRTLGFPTANIVPNDPDKIIPGDGVYAVSVHFKNGDEKPGMLNIGQNPTFPDSKKTIEVNIFDFNEDIYNTLISVEFHHKIRKEVRFNSPEELIAQLEKDKAAALDLLS
ncbi:MAG: bifunctional riboflavin kinase/FAD synthetase [bacterium]|nr:bifunctional riboflavin kinase/FAD synthetase [bacterium]